MIATPKTIILTFTALLLFTIAPITATPKLKFVVQIMRHGARTPSKKITKGEDQPKWIESVGNGKITPIGQRQLFNVGKQMHYRYSELFKNGKLN